MKRISILVVLAGMVLGGCDSSVQGPAPGAGPEHRTITPAAGENAASAEPDISKGLVAWWKFDETSGKTAQDSSGNGRKGTLMGELSFAEGRMGNALNFESEDAFVQIEGYKGITGTKPRTVSAWIKTKEGDGWILAWGRDEAGEMFKFGHFRGRIGIIPKGGYLFMNETTRDDNWRHIAAVVQEAELPNLHDHVNLYLDGEEAEIHDIGILDLWPIDTGSELDVVIGKGFRGLLDDVRIYARPLSEEEIELLYKSAEK
jgi:hypothetical protein